MHTYIDKPIFLALEGLLCKFRSGHSMPWMSRVETICFCLWHQAHDKWFIASTFCARRPPRCPTNSSSSFHKQGACSTEESCHAHGGGKQSCLYTAAPVQQLRGQRREGKEVCEQSRIPQQSDRQPVITIHLHLESRWYCNQRLLGAEILSSRWGSFRGWMLLRSLNGLKGGFIGQQL